MTRDVRLFGTAAICAFAVATCGEPTLPQFSGTYELRLVGGNPIPQPTWPAGLDTIYSDTVTVSQEGSLARFEHVRQVWVGTQRVRAVDSVHFYWEGDRLKGTLPCPINANCALTERFAELNGDTLRISFEIPGPAPWVFVRIE